MTDTAAAVLVRPARAQDCRLLAGLLTEAFVYHGDRPPLAGDGLARRLEECLGAQPGFEALLAELPGADKDTAAGCAIFSPVFHTAECAPALFLKELFVREASRRKGVGRALLRALCDLAVARGWPRMIWTADRGNPLASRFYAALPGVDRHDKQVYALAGDALARLAAAGSERRRTGSP